MNLDLLRKAFMAGAQCFDVDDEGHTWPDSEASCRSQFKMFLKINSPEAYALLVLQEKEERLQDLLREKTQLEVEISNIQKECAR